MITISTTKVQVLRPAAAAEGDAEFRDPHGDSVPVGGPVRAHISSPTGSRSFDPSGSDTTSQYKLLTDPCDLRDGDQVQDLADDLVYEVQWAVLRRGLLPHMVAGISETQRLS